MDGQNEKGIEINKVVEKTKRRTICLLPSSIFRVKIYVRSIESKVNPPIIFARGSASRIGKVSDGLIKLRITKRTNTIIGLFIQRIEKRIEMIIIIIKRA